MKPHPLLLRFLAATGLGSTALLAAAGGSVNCCPPPEDTGPYTASLHAGCSVDLDSSLKSLYELCVDVPEATCPAFADAGAYLQGSEAVCGPFPRTGTPTSSSGASTTTASTTAASTSTSTSASTSSGSGAGGGGGAGGSGGAGGAPPTPTIQCCYGIVNEYPAGQGCGRPLLVDGAPRFAAVTSRSDWSAEQPDVALQPDARRALVEGFCRDAALEHASVASFARFTSDLLALGAPGDLVRGALQAGLDEIDHARRCWALASRYARAPLGPSTLDAGTDSARHLVDVAARALVEGCIGETIAAVVAADTLGATTDPAAREAMAVIARDEARHAELAFRFIAWVARDPAARPLLRERAERALRDAAPGPAPAPTAVDLAAEAHGQASPQRRARAARVAIDEVVRPALAALLSV